LRILLDKNVPVGLRQFFSGPDYALRTLMEMGWPEQLENGELLEVAEASGFDVLLTADQNIPYQQNLSGRRLALVVLGSNIWPVLQEHRNAIVTMVVAAKPGTCHLVEIPLPPKRGSL
jgi:hypothetical protein